MSAIQAPFYPIIYLRGYAMTQGEIEATTVDPFCGFNLGSTVMRAVPEKDRRPRKHVFESPLVRLASDFGYNDVYEDGYDIMDPEWEITADGKPTKNKLTGKSIVIHRYYDPTSKLLGNNAAPDIKDFAKDLSQLVQRVRRLVCANPQNDVTPDNFRCYLVAHSMGGLVCRAFLQNSALDPCNTSRHVAKLFTYATPHNGIEVAGFNVPASLGWFDLNNFNRDTHMVKYLALEEDAPKNDGRVDLVPESRFPSRNIFCMIGTNRMDYDVAAGLSRTFVGHGSDGLVRIENATLHGLNKDGSKGEPCAKAFAYRSHSGPYGIVNSEEAYQNLVRFLFGDVRVDIWMDIEDIRLPPAVQARAKAKKEVNALYLIELKASPRGKFWYLTRRTAEEDSAACVAHAGWKSDRHQYLSTVFLANRARVNKNRPSLAYAMDVGVRVPDYEIERRLWIDEHYEGGYIFRNALILELIPPAGDHGQWRVKYAWQDSGMANASQELPVQSLDHGRIEVTIAFDSQTAGPDGIWKQASPGIQGQLRFVVSAWNA